MDSSRTHWGWVCRPLGPQMHSSDCRCLFATGCADPCAPGDGRGGPRPPGAWHSRSATAARSHQHHHYRWQHQQQPRHAPMLVVHAHTLGPTRSRGPMHCPVRQHQHITAPNGGRRPALQDGFHEWDTGAVALHVLRAVRAVRPDLVSSGLEVGGVGGLAESRLPGLCATLCQHVRTAFVLCAVGLWPPGLQYSAQSHRRVPWTPNVHMPGPYLRWRWRVRPPQPHQRLPRAQVGLHRLRARSATDKGTLQHHTLLSCVKSQARKDTRQHRAVHRCVAAAGPAQHHHHCAPCCHWSEVLAHTCNALCAPHRTVHPRELVATHGSRHPDPVRAQGQDPEPHAGATGGTPGRVSATVYTLVSRMHTTLRARQGQDAKPALHALQHPALLQRPACTARGLLHVAA